MCALKHGYSRDDRPELKQVVLQFISIAEAPYVCYTVQ